MSSLPLPSIETVRKRYQAALNQELSLDLTRGKPGNDQLALSADLFDKDTEKLMSQSALDIRNYGGIDGLKAMKSLFANILQVPEEQVIVGGNSSLTMMHDYLTRACLFGEVDSPSPWSTRKDRKFICPTPGYDRHFLITEHLGFELITVDMLESGPDMDQVESLVANDASVLGMWCVPKYSNPTGSCCSDETVNRLAKMHTAASDFRIIWDNAYAEHGFSNDNFELANVLALCHEAGHTNRVIEFASTSKITFPGAGVAAMAASSENMDHARKQISVQSIGPDKINQARHLLKFPDITALRGHMQEHAKLVAPKFQKVEDVLQTELGGTGLAQWSTPAGGYFINLDTENGLAKTVVALAAKAGVSLTKAGAPFPYGKDPHDRNIRIAPTFASVDELAVATEVLGICIQLASLESKA